MIMTNIYVHAPISLITALFFLLFSTTSWADTPTWDGDVEQGEVASESQVDSVASSEESTEDDGPRHIISVTISPLHLILPFVELVGEYRLMDEVGLALVVGGGSLSSPNIDYNVNIFQLGVQGNYYFFGDFDHGAHAGVDILGMRASASDGGIDASATSGLLGIFLGYKVIASFGVTFVIQAGIQHTVILAEATDGTTSVEQTASGLGPLLNLNLGWSF